MLDFVWAASTAAQTLLMIRSFTLRGDWPAWNLWLVASVVEAMLVAATRVFAASSAYFWVWLTSDTVVIVLLVLAMLEVYHRRAERRLEVDRAGRWITALAIGLALVWAAWSAPSLTWDWLLQGAFRMRGLVAVALGASAVIVLCLYAVFPCPTAPVVVRHHVLTAAYLVLFAIEATAQSIAPQAHLRQIEIVAITASAFIFLVWAKIIGPIPPQTPPARGTEADQLDAEQLRLEGAIRQAQALMQPKPDQDE